MKKIGELPAITDVPAGSLLIVNTENGTKKITYEDLCQAVKATLGIPTVVQSIYITEPMSGCGRGRRKMGISLMVRLLKRPLIL